MFLVFYLFLVSPSAADPAYISLAERLSANPSHARILQETTSVVVDFSIPLDQKRLFVLDNKNKQILQSFHVGHAYRTGDMKANRFSNIRNSRKSSLGLFVLIKKYNSRFFDYSYRLKGLDKTNNNAMKRGIVIHEQGDYPGEILPTNSRQRYYQLLTDGCFSLFPADIIKLSVHLNPGLMILAIK